MSEIECSDVTKELSIDVFKILQTLYGVVVALAITTAIGLTISTDGVALSPFNLDISRLCLFGAFFVTIVPFYHGGSMYLLTKYIRANPPKKKGVALVDFLALTFEGVFFYAIAASVTDLVSFEGWFMFLLILDTLWLGFTYIAHEGKDKCPAPKCWVIFNGAMLVFLLVIYGIDANIWPQIHTLILLAALIRTIADYAICYDDYFPSN